jgi:hypothetical protein
MRATYIDKNGFTKNYIPDFLINDNIIIEIKPKSLLKLEINKLKIARLKKYCKENHLICKIITEKELEDFECKWLNKRKR